MGSCFVEHMGERLRYFQFQTTENPFGVIFQPLALEKLLERACRLQDYDKADLFQHQELWKCFEVHSDLNALSSEILMANLNARLLETHDALRAATHVVITLGTAWAYRYRDTGALVANCHKVPQQSFEKELLPIAAIKSSLEHMYELIREMNPGAAVIFTVSPVRHLRDGFVENQRSKAHLIAALHQFLDESPEYCFYFPAYEILMDELRDYRFYASDMVHPSDQAVSYVWEKFCASWLDQQCIPVMKEVEQLRRGLAHRPFNPDAAAHKRFIAQLEEARNSLIQRFPYMDFGE